MSMVKLEEFHGDLPVFVNPDHVLLVTEYGGEKWERKVVGSCVYLTNYTGPIYVKGEPEKVAQALSHPLRPL